MTFDDAFDALHDAAIELAAEEQLQREPRKAVVDALEEATRVLERIHARRCAAPALTAEEGLCAPP